MRTITFLVLISFLLTSLAPASFAAKNKGKSKGKKSYSGVSARAASLMDSKGAKLLYSKNAQKQVLPASTTKVMTALLVLENLKLDDYVTVPQSATRVQPSKLYLRPGDKYRVRDLLYALLLNSANDVGVTLAVAVAGSESKFVDMMNQRAKALGAKNTRFANSHGLPSKAAQYSTPYDMSIILRQALKNKFFEQVITAKFRSITSKEGRRHVLRSHNKMLFKGWREPVYGKTGYTRMARSCFVGYVDKGSKRLIVAVFGCTRRWDDIKYIIEKYGGVNL